MLSVRCLSVCLSVYVRALWPNGWTHQDELDMQVGLGPGHIVLSGDPAPLPQTGGSAIFGPYLL